MNGIVSLDDRRLFLTKIASSLIRTFIISVPMYIIGKRNSVCECVCWSTVAFRCV